MQENKMDIESAFNLLVGLARAQKLSWDEHQKVSVAIETVLAALNEDKSVTTRTELGSQEKEPKEKD